MSYTNEEQLNLDAVQQALKAASTDFANLAEVFSDDIKWTITGSGPVARTFNGMKDLLDNGRPPSFREYLVI